MVEVPKTPRHRCSTDSSYVRRHRTASTRSVHFDTKHDVEMIEPFSDSEDEGREKIPPKLRFFLPRKKIRTLSRTFPAIGYSPQWGGATMCLSCLEFFNLPNQSEEFEKHLFEHHKIVIKEIFLIADLKRYVEHWRQRFAKQSINKVFERIEPKEGDKYFGQTEYYFEIGPKNDEDRSLRQKLAKQRLEEALSCQQAEREDRGFHLQCIFCRYVATGNRAKIVHHLFNIHHLNLGSPENLVFVKEYVESLRSKIEASVCFCCEKEFDDKNSLMEHVRKKSHREVNPKNHYYDKFYIINYLILGKRWRDVIAEDFEDPMPTFEDSDDEELDTWDDWLEDNSTGDENYVVCLMCDHNVESVSDLLSHMKEEHNLHLLKEIAKDKLDMLDRVKLINYIRKKNFEAHCWVCGKGPFATRSELRQHYKQAEIPFTGLPSRELWQNDENLIPLYENDHLLWKMESYLQELCPEQDESKKGAGDCADALDCSISAMKEVYPEDLPRLQELTIDVNELK